jgi:tetratricopeptide (TPR) repeat protein
LVKQAYDSAKKLAQTNPDLPGMDYALGRAAEVMGQLTEPTDAKAGDDYYTEAHQSYGQCLNKNAKDVGCLNSEFLTLGRIGNMLYDAKQYNDAMSMYQKSLEVAQQYARLVPPGPEVAAYIGGRYDHIGRIYFDNNDFDNAMAQFTKAQAAMEPWMNDPHITVTFMTELANAYNSIANVLIGQISSARDRNGKTRQALLYTEKAENITQALAFGDPSNAAHWTNLFIDDDNLSVLNGQLGNKALEQAYAAKRDQAQQRAQAVAPASRQKAPAQ